MNIGDVTVAGANMCMGAFVVGTLSAAIYVVSKFALPKLGYDTIRNIPLTKVSREAFKVTVVCYAFIAAIVGIVTLAFVIINPKFGCGGDDMS